MTLIDPDVQELLDNTMQPFLEQQSKIVAPIYGDKMIPHDNSCKGSTLEIKIKAGKTSEIGHISDGGAIDVVGRRVPFSIINQTPAIIYGRMRMPRGEANQTHDSKSVVDLVTETLEEFGETYLSEIGLGMIFGGIYEGSLTAAMVTALGTGGGAGYNLLNAATEAAPINFTVTDPGRYEVGQALDFYSIVTATGVATLQARAIVSAVTPNFASGVHTVSMYGSGEVTATTTPISGATNPVQVCQRGAYASGSATRQAMLGLAQVCDPSYDLYGFSSNLKNWKPQSHDASAGALTGSKLRQMHVQLAGQKAGSSKFVLLNSENLNSLHEEMVADRRIEGMQYDVTDYNQTGKIGAIPFKVDDNTDSTHAYFVDPADLELGVFQSVLTDGDGAPGKDKGKMHWQVDQTSFNIFSEQWAIHQMKCKRRSSLGQIYNIG
jgi:hypothetical protein